MLRKLLLLILLVSLTACTTTIGNKNDLNTINFAVQKTTKSEVSEYLGLPSKIIKKEEEGKEYWYYTKGAKLSGIQVWAPAGGTHNVETIHTGSPTTDLDYAALFVFDKNQKLIEIQK